MRILFTLFILFPCLVQASQFFCTAYCATQMPVPPGIPNQYFGLCRTDPEFNTTTRSYTCPEGQISEMPNNPYAGQIYYLGFVTAPGECLKACEEEQGKGRVCQGWNTQYPGRDFGLTPQRTEGRMRACEATTQ